MSVLIALLGTYIAGLIVSWHIYDVDGPKTSNVSAAIIIQLIKHTGKVLGTIFWPIVLLFETIDFFYDLYSRVVER